MSLDFDSKLEKFATELNREMFEIAEELFLPVLFFLFGTQNYFVPIKLQSVEFCALKIV